MNIPLDQFEQIIDGTILERGLGYFQRGRVQEPEEISPGEYEAIVEGTEDYTVRLTIANQTITDHDCDCPYDYGPVCKHVVALIFHLLQDEIALETKKKASSPAKAPKKKTVSQRLDELLLTISHDELKQFVREEALKNAAMRELFFTHFAQPDANESKEFYAKRIKSILRKASDEYGYIEWSAWERVDKAVSDLLELARKQLDKRNPQTAVFITTAIMEQMAHQLDAIDDSDGDFQQYIDDAFQILQAVADQPTEEIRQLLLKECFAAVERNTYAGLDWHQDMLAMAAELVQTQEEIRRVMELLARENQSEYTLYHTQTIQHSLLLRTQGPEAAERFLRQNLSNPEFRKMAIQKEMEGRRYDKAIALAQSGLDECKDTRPGLANEWRNWLLRIAQAQGDTEKIIAYARQLYLLGNTREQDYYQVLKEHVQPQAWTAFVEALVGRLEAQNYGSQNKVADIFIREQWWDRLWDLVQKNPNFENLKRYDEQLAPYYARPIAELYAKAIQYYMARNMGRDHYKAACGYILRMRQLGAADLAQSTIDHLRAEYPRRSALMDELRQLDARPPGGGKKKGW